MSITQPIDGLRLLLSGAAKRINDEPSVGGRAGETGMEKREGKNESEMGREGERQGAKEWEIDGEKTRGRENESDTNKEGKREK